MLQPWTTQLALVAGQSAAASSCLGPAACLWLALLVCVPPESAHSIPASADLEPCTPRSQNEASFGNGTAAAPPVPAQGLLQTEPPQVALTQSSQPGAPRLSAAQLKMCREVYAGLHATPAPLELKACAVEGVGHLCGSDAEPAPPPPPEELDKAATAPPPWQSAFTPGSSSQEPAPPPEPVNMPWHSAPEAMLAMQKTAPQPFPKPAAGCASAALKPY